jgi:hypothetical protein
VARSAAIQSPTPPYQENIVEASRSSLAFRVQRYRLLRLLLLLVLHLLAHRASVLSPCVPLFTFVATV